MQFTYDGETYKIQFAYGLIHQESVPDRRTTVCSIWRWTQMNAGEFTPPASVGVAVCDSREQFIKEKGRRLALDKALRRPRRLCRREVTAPLPPFPKEVRRAAWQAYLNRPRPKSTRKNRINNHKETPNADR